MVRATIATLVLGLFLTGAGVAPVVTADPVAGGSTACQMPPNSVGGQGLGDAEAVLASDTAWNTHVAYVESALAETPTTEALFQLPDGLWTPDRVRQQNELIDQYWQVYRGESVPREGRAIIAGGVSGVGKTTVLQGQPAIENQRYFTINPDDVKELMAARSMIPAIAGLSPMEASANAHEEASMLAKRLADRAYWLRTNVVWDITMSSEASVRERIAAMREAGYSQIDGVFVDAPLQTARVRVMQRWRRGQEKYWAGEGLGGRYVPADFIDMSKPDKPGFSSRNEEIFDRVREQFSSTVEYDTSGAEPVLRCVTGPRWN